MRVLMGWSPGVPGTGEFGELSVVEWVGWVRKLVGTEREERSDPIKKTMLAKATEMRRRQKSLERVLRRIFAIMLREWFASLLGASGVLEKAVLFCKADNSKSNKLGDYSVKEISTLRRLQLSSVIPPGS